MADDRQKAKRDNRFHVGAIDSQLGGGRLRRFVAGQEQDECRRILWIFWSSEWDVAHASGMLWRSGPG
ncbi:hypothetical protein A4G27_03620 [Mycobacterium kansasii]|nr:hypothetical protein A4G27_03620 [Mycobacterium kansasii]